MPVPQFMSMPKTSRLVPGTLSRVEPPETQSTLTLKSITHAPHPMYLACFSVSTAGGARGGTLTSSPKPPLAPFRAARVGISFSYVIKHLGENQQPMLQFTVNTYCLHYVTTCFSQPYCLEFVYICFTFMPMINYLHSLHPVCDKIRCKTLEKPKQCKSGDFCHIRAVHTTISTIMYLQYMIKWVKNRSPCQVFQTGSLC